MKHLNANLDATTNIEVPVEETIRILGLDGDNNIVEIMGGASSLGDMGGGGSSDDTPDPADGDSIDDMGGGGGDSDVMEDQMICITLNREVDSCYVMGSSITLTRTSNGDSIVGTIDSVTTTRTPATTGGNQADCLGNEEGDPFRSGMGGSGIYYEWEVVDHRLSNDTFSGMDAIGYDHGIDWPWEYPNGVRHWPLENVASELIGNPVRRRDDGSIALSFTENEQVPWNVGRKLYGRFGSFWDLDTYNNIAIGAEVVTSRGSGEGTTTLRKVRALNNYPAPNWVFGGAGFAWEGSWPLTGGNTYGNGIAMPAGAVVSASFIQRPWAFDNAAELIEFYNSGAPFIDTTFNTLHSRYQFQDAAGDPAGTDTGNPGATQLVRIGNANWPQNNTYGVNGTTYYWHQTTGEWYTEMNTLGDTTPSGTPLCVAGGNGDPINLGGTPGSVSNEVCFTVNTVQNPSGNPFALTDSAAGYNISVVCASPDDGSGGDTMGPGDLSAPQCAERTIGSTYRPLTSAGVDYTGNVPVEASIFTNDGFHSILIPRVSLPLLDGYTGLTTTYSEVPPQQLQVTQLFEAGTDTLQTQFTVEYSSARLNSTDNANIELAGPLLYTSTTTIGGGRGTGFMANQGNVGSGITDFEGNDIGGHIKYFWPAGSDTGTTLTNADRGTTFYLGTVSNNIRVYYDGTIGSNYVFVSVEAASGVFFGNATLFTDLVGGMTPSGAEPLRFVSGNMGLLIHSSGTVRVCLPGTTGGDLSTGGGGLMTGGGGISTSDGTDPTDDTVTTANLTVTGLTDNTVPYVTTDGVFADSPITIDTSVDPDCVRITGQLKVGTGTAVISDDNFIITHPTETDHRVQFSTGNATTSPFFSMDDGTSSLLISTLHTGGTSVSAGAGDNLVISSGGITSVSAAMNSNLLLTTSGTGRVAIAGNMIGEGFARVDAMGNISSSGITQSDLPDISYGDTIMYSGADLATFITEWNAGTNTNFGGTNPTVDLHAGDIVVVNTGGTPVTYLYTGADSVFSTGPDVVAGSFTQISLGSTGPAINPTNGVLPYRQDANTLVDSSISETAGTTITVDDGTTAAWGDHESTSGSTEIGFRVIINLAMGGERLDADGFVGATISFSGMQTSLSFLNNNSYTVTRVENDFLFFDGGASASAIDGQNITEQGSGSVVSASTVTVATNLDINAETTITGGLIQSSGEWDLRAISNNTRINTDSVGLSVSSTGNIQLTASGVSGVEFHNTGEVRLNGSGITAGTDAAPNILAVGADGDLTTANVSAGTTISGTAGTLPVFNTDGDNITDSAVSQVLGTTFTSGGGTILTGGSVTIISLSGLTVDALIGQTVTFGTIVQTGDDTGNVNYATLLSGNTFTITDNTADSITFATTMTAPDATARSATAVLTGDIIIGATTVTVAGDLTVTGESTFTGEATFSDNIIATSINTDGVGRALTIGADGTSTQTFFRGSRVRYFNTGDVIFQHGGTFQINTDAGDGGDGDIDFDFHGDLTINTDNGNHDFQMTDSGARWQTNNNLPILIQADGTSGNTALSLVADTGEIAISSPSIAGATDAAPLNLVVGTGGHIMTAALSSGGSGLSADNLSSPHLPYYDGTELQDSPVEVTVGSTTMMNGFIQLTFTTGTFDYTAGTGVISGQNRADIELLAGAALTVGSVGVGGTDVLITVVDSPSAGTYNVTVAPTTGNGNTAAQLQSQFENTNHFWLGDYNVIEPDSTQVTGDLTVTGAITGSLNNLNASGMNFQIWAGTQAEFTTQFDADGSGTVSGTAADTTGATIYIIR